MKRLLLLPLFLCLIFSGCTKGLVFQDYREIDQMTPVQTLGIDRNGDLVTATASTISDGGSVVLKNSSLTVSRAIREMQNYTEKKYIFYGHTAHLLVGEAEAARGISRCLEFVERDSEVRLDTDLYVVQQGTAEKVISACSSGENSIGDLLDSLNKDVQLMSESYVFSCGDTAEALEERGCALVSAVALRDSDNLLQGGNGPSLQSCGYAIVTKNGLLGYLDRNLARGANLLMDKSGSDVLEVSCGNRLLAARLTDSQCRYTPRFEADRLAGLEIAITVRCNVDDLLPPEQTVSESIIHELEAALASLEQTRAETVLCLSQELNADFCGLGLRVRQAAPLRFDQMEESWRECFPGLDISVAVQAKLERSYDAGLNKEEGR